MIRCVSPFLSQYKILFIFYIYKESIEWVYPTVNFFLNSSKLVLSKVYLVGKWCNMKHWLAKQGLQVKEVLKTKKMQHNRKKASILVKNIIFLI